MPFLVGGLVLSLLATTVLPRDRGNFLSTRRHRMCEKDPAIDPNVEHRTLREPWLNEIDELHIVPQTKKYISTYNLNFTAIETPFSQSEQFPDIPTSLC